MSSTYKSSKFDNIEGLDWMHLNPYLTNGFSHYYHLGESTFIFRGVRCDFKFLSHFSVKFLKANRIAPDGTPRSAASHLGLNCLPMSQLFEEEGLERKSITRTD